MLNHLVDIKLFSYKKSNKPIFLQELECISVYKLDQNYFLFLATKKPITKVTPTNKQEHIA